MTLPTKREIAAAFKTRDMDALRTLALQIADSTVFGLTEGLAPGSIDELGVIVTVRPCGFAESRVVHRWLTPDEMIGRQHKCAETNAPEGQSVIAICYEPNVDDMAHGWGPCDAENGRVVINAWADQQLHGFVIACNRVVVKGGDDL
tara:strand:- start:68 stop:508 length:441 start_codon:yes stop_codon:yes gene_type:complete